MTDQEKLIDLCNFCETLNFSQKIIFSDEGNLHSKFAVRTGYQQYIDKKPIGLWFCHGKSWIDYLLDELQWGITRINKISHIYEIKLNGKICKVKNNKEFVAFEKKYKKKDLINWEKVEQDYNGIDIFYGSNTQSNWHDSWDVSSGVVWDRDGIDNIVLLKSWKRTWR